MKAPAKVMKVANYCDQSMAMGQFEFYIMIAEAVTTPCNVCALECSAVRPGQDTRPKMSAVENSV